MELLLWRWSTTAQITSELMIAVFFVVLARSVRRVEMRPWIQAWLWNLVALFVTIIFWFAQPKSRIAFMATVFGYTLSKTIFSVLLVAGTWNFVRRRPGIDVRRGRHRVRDRVFDRRPRSRSTRSTNSAPRSPPSSA